MWDPSIFWEEEAFIILSPRNCDASRGIFASLGTFLSGGFHANILRSLSSHHDVIDLTSVSPELVVVTPPVGVGACNWLGVTDLAVVKQLSSITKLWKYQSSYVNLLLTTQWTYWASHCQGRSYHPAPCSQRSTETRLWRRRDERRDTPSSPEQRPSLRETSWRIQVSTLTYLCQSLWISEEMMTAAWCISQLTHHYFCMFWLRRLILHW